MKKITFIIALFLLTVGVQAQHHMDHSSHNSNKEMAKLVKNPKVLELNSAMKELWNAHMYWTLITVDAFFNDPKGLESKLTRLLQNQQDIGNAIKPFYGEEAGNALAKLLTEHIELAVPVLTAAKDEQEDALNVAVKNWYKNAEEIGDFLATANPKNWSAKETRGAMEMHISHTIAYSVSILKGDYNESFGGFEEALGHMIQLADILTEGIVKQFPKQFK